MKKQSEFELRKISGGVFDKSTLMALYKLSRKDCFDEIRSIISTGKEANVYHGLYGDRDVAVKIYAMEASDFKNMDRYIRGDKRFGKWKNRRELVYSWAKKEFKNLSRVYEDVNCPEPLGVEKNVLVMEFIGEKGTPAPRMKDLAPEKPEEYFEILIDDVRKIYSHGLVHGDLSEYNILNWGRPVIIDFSMGVLKSHPIAEELLGRDVKNICKYFGKLGIEKDEKEILKYIKKVKKKNKK